MENSRYVNLLSDIARLGEGLMCTCCGTETPSIYDIDICTNCENLVYASRKTLANRNPELVGNLDAIRMGIDEGKFEQAIAVYDRIEKNSSLLYAEALAYIKYSNSEVAKVDYTVQGTENGNAKFIKNSVELTSRSKYYLVKAIGAVRGDIEKGTVSLGNLYLMFMTQLKFGSIRAASHALQQLGKVGDAYVAGYANLAFDANMGRYDEIIKRADAMMGGEHGINVFYYLALALFKKNRVKESVALLTELQKIMKSANVDALLHEIGRMDGE